LSSAKTLAVTGGGTIIITNIGPALQAGDTFTLLSATGYSGSFSSPTLPALGANLAWNTTNLTVNGTISVVTVTVPAVNTTVALSSSSQTNGYLAGVTFTAMVQTNGVTAGNAGGSMQFQTNGVLFNTIPVTNGTATSVVVTNLPRGTDLITAIYSGDSNYLPNTNTLNQVVTNHPPVAPNVTYYRAKGQSLQIPIANLLTNVTDVDGDTITLQSIGLGTNGAIIASDAVNIYYAPSSGAGSNNNDSFPYTVSDGFGGTATADILVDVYSTGNAAILGGPTNGVISIQFFGFPLATYVVQTTTNVTAAWWPLSTNIAGSNGSWLFTDPNATNQQQYYRATQP
jgi:hypothetical protein